MGQCDGARRRAGRIRPGSQAAARRRYRRPRKYLGRSGAARRRRSRRTQARDSAEDRRPRTTTPRRLAIDSARIDPKRDLTDWLSARRLSRYSLSERSPARYWSPDGSAVEQVVFLEVRTVD